MLKKTTAGTPAPYAPLCFRSYFSLMQGLYSPEELCIYAKQQGYPAVAMVDLNNFYGLIRFLQAAAIAQIKPVAGVAVCQGGRELYTAYVLDINGFARINGILSQLLYATSPYLRLESQYDPVSDLAAGGWQGLAIATEDQAVLTTLAKVSGKGLYCKLVYGKSFIENLRLARQLAIPPLAVNEVVYLHESDRELYHMLRAIDLNIPVFKIPDQERLLRLHQAVEPLRMQQFYSAVPEALDNSWQLIQQASTEGIISQEFIFPAYEKMSRTRAFSELKSLCNNGITRRYGQATTEIMTRLDYELAIIREKNFANYFLVVKDIISTCPRTCGRGSSASSIVSYLLEITHIDPLKHNLFFERFLNRGRKDPPDIDVDFPWNERNKVLKYVFDKYQGYSGMVANHVTLAHRASLRETAKALGIRQEDIKKIMHLHHLRRDEQIPVYITKIAQRIRGFPRYIGLHCGGVVITPRPIACYTHIQPSLAGYPVIAWEKEATEAAGLVKIDLLGNRSLGVLRDTINLIGRRYQREIDWAAFNPLADVQTRQLIEQGNTLGIFYIESPATRQLLKKMRRGSYENIIIASSIIRPAANKYIRQFVERLHRGGYTPLHHCLAVTLQETFGILVYQEDVSRVAIDLVGFSIEEADALRKIIAKKNTEQKLADFKTRFFEGGRANGVGEAALREVWEMILSFKGYSFCKAHSASYALVSYKLAYCKRYYPAEFMVSVINNGGGFYSCQTYLNELQRMGFPVLGPDVNRSRYRYTIEGVKVRVGLCQLAETSTPFLKKLMAERKKALFKDLADFITRMDPGLQEMRILIRSGALDSLAGDLTRPQIFWFFFTFHKEDSLFLLPPVPAFIGDYPEMIKVADEIATLGVIISRHPLKIFRQRILRLIRRQGIPGVISSRDIPAHRNRFVYLAGLIVTGKEVPTRTDERMIFVSFEDPHSIYETVFFPASYRRFYHLLDTRGVYLIYGRVEDELGALSVNVQWIMRINRVQ